MCEDSYIFKSKINGNVPKLDIKVYFNPLLKQYNAAVESIDQWNKTKKPKIDSCICYNLINEKVYIIR